MPPPPSLSGQPPGILAALQRDLYLSPHWGMLMGALAAVAAMGVLPTATMPAVLWERLGSQLFPNVAMSTSQQGVTGVAGMLALWGIALAVCAWVVAKRPSARLQWATAGMATLLLGAATLGARSQLGLWVDPTLPAVMLWGALAGRAAHASWMRAIERHKTEIRRRVADAVAKAKGDYLGQIAREMRTPVNAVLGVADLMAESGLDAQQRRHLEVFRRSADSLTRLVDDLSELSKLDAGRIQLVQGNIALVPLLQEQMALAKPRADAKGIKLELTVSSELPGTVRGDARRLSQVIAQLLAQAVRVTQRGAVRLEVRPHARSSDKVRFAFTDTGSGPESGKLASIVEPFHAPAVQSPRSGSGSGIGLALARRIIEVMGGRLAVRRAAGRGSTLIFSADLPAVQTLVAAPAAASTASAAVTPGVPAAAAPSPVAGAMPKSTPSLQSVLLVDDNVSTRQLLEAMLDKRHFRVTSCASGHEALDHLERTRFAVVLLDLEMPELDGEQVLKILRRRESERSWKRTPVIALGSAPFETERQRWLDAGFDQHLCKPVRKSSLIESIARLTVESPGVLTEAAADSSSTLRLRSDQREALALLGAAGVVDVRRAVDNLGGDAVLYLDALEHLAPALNNWLDRFRQTLDRQERDRARQMAVDMQGILEVMGAAACAASVGRVASVLAAQKSESAESEALLDLELHLRPVMDVLHSAVQGLRAARQARSRSREGQDSAF